MNQARVEILITELLRAVEDVLLGDELRPGIAATPRRVAAAFAEWFSGYYQDDTAIADMLDAVFHDDVVQHYDQMVIVKGIEFQSFCEHHMAPFHGIAHIGYIPGGEGVFGLSKLARLLDVYAKRLQVQERLTEQVANALHGTGKTKGVMVVIEAVHTCMTSRGARAHGSSTVTSACRGALFTEASARAEFLNLIKL